MEAHEISVEVERNIKAEDGVYIRTGKGKEQDVLWLWDDEIALCVKKLVDELEWMAEGKPLYTTTSKGKAILKNIKGAEK